MKVILRRAVEKDIPQIAEIFRVESSKPPYNKNRTSQKALEVIKEDFETNDIYVAEEGDRIAGFIMVRRDSGIRNQMWINELWISKEFQRKGIGKRLITEVEKIYKMKGIDTIKLVSDTGDGGALEFYKKLNYKIDNSMVFLERRLK